MLNIVNVSLPSRCRIICISDLHTHWQETKKLLEHCNYKPDEDYLFILGDILERGDDNINALRYVMKLAENKRVIVISGNNDMFVHDFAVGYNQEKFCGYFNKKPNRCFVEMAESIGITDFQNKPMKKRKMVYEAFETEINFIMNLPDAIETQQHIFIHAGIEGNDWHNMTTKTAKNLHRFINLNHESDKTVICGHFPCYNAGRQNSNLPIFDFKRRIIDIDGGACVTLASQVNALIIDKNDDEYNYQVKYSPIGEAKTVISDYSESRTWYYADRKQVFSLLLPDKDTPTGFIKARNNETNAEGVIPECMSGYWDDAWHVWANLNSFSRVKKGELIWIYAEYGEYCWCITESGEVGSVPKIVIDLM